MDPKYLIGSYVFKPNGNEGEVINYNEEDECYEIEWENGDTTWEAEENVDRWSDEEDDDYEPDVDEAQEWADFDPDC